MPSCVIDTSVLLQVARGEPGALKMLPRLAEGCVSAVNLAEGVDALIRKGAPREVAESALRPLVYHVVPFDTVMAWQVGRVREAAGETNLSLGDVACLATARTLGLGVLTNDTVWREHDFGVVVELGRRPTLKTP